MPVLFAEGGNFRFEIDDQQIARFRVWRRPDLDSAAGARLAEAAVHHFHLLAATREQEARGLLMDLREGPVVAGPVTQRHVSAMLSAWARCRRPLSVVVGSSPIQLLQYRRLVSDNCPHRGAVFNDIDAAEVWIASEIGVEPRRTHE